MEMIPQVIVVVIVAVVLAARHVHAPFFDVEMRAANATGGVERGKFLVKRNFSFRV